MASPALTVPAGPSEPKGVERQQRDGRDPATHKRLVLQLHGVVAVAAAAAAGGGGTVVVGMLWTPDLS
ncbi:uncharacterized protein THITE_2114983 [Thermothielavioides terrestris NRRL 8126]|uniref:Uncharacterized protein n=1 Tax=Thermothielavioides terrestris (strain ATCC 38088 / NRRL 8126) TaxID=578455 RepID=G2R2L6_THETT|nr:uncharacterized protein THITE_2114983 [Thermothielavioides terrestris NRRL 8126]AEO66692.1 hypothetical protein THITE_2114983 [Thermothielavioides terrestris NRRL 8126]